MVCSTDADGGGEKLSHSVMTLSPPPTSHIIIPPPPSLITSCPSLSIHPPPLSLPPAPLSISLYEWCLEMGPWGRFHLS